MLGSKRLTVDSTLVNPAAFTPFAAGALELGFQVEEEEMLVDLEASVTYSNTVLEATDFTLFVNSGAGYVDIETVGTNGLLRWTPALAGNQLTMKFGRTVRLNQGFNSVQVRVKAPTGDVTARGATVPCELVARRHSHPATLGHGVDSKVQLVQ